MCGTVLINFAAQYKTSKIHHMLKRILPLITMAALSFSANAQTAITLTENDIISVGNVAYLVTDTAPVSAMSTQAIQSGANVTWDFTKVNSHVSDEITFVTPSSTTYGSYFPQSNLCAVTKSTGFNAYFTSSTNSFVMTGIVGDLLEMGVNVKAFFTPGQTLMEFPSTYQSTFNSPYTATAKEYYGKTENVDIGGILFPVFVDSVSAKYEYTVSSEIDGYGTVITPQGSYSALRQKLVETEVDSQYAYVQGMGWFLVDATTYTTNRLRWWANGVGYALAECKLNTNKTKIKGEFQYVSDTDPVVTSIAGIDFDDDIMSFPNPASDQIQFINLPEKAAYILMSDITGKELVKLNIKDQNGAYSISNYNNGMYLYQILDINENHLNQGRFNILH
jgi:hypothetical protein